MINVSLNDLMIGNERPTPRTTPRSEASAFAALLDHETATRGDDGAAPAKPRDRAEASQDGAPASSVRVSETDSRTDRPDDQLSPAPTERSAHRPADTPHSGQDHTIETADADAPRSSGDATPAKADTAQSAEATGEAAAAATDKDRAIANDAGQAVATDAALVPQPSPASPLSSDVALLVAPGLVPQIFSPLATTAPTATTLPTVQAVGPAASSATQSTNKPALPQLGTDGPAIVPATESTAAGDTPVANPATSTKTFSETLFAATMLALPEAAGESGIVVPAGFKPQAAPVTRGIGATATPDPSAANPLPEGVPALDKAPKSAAVPAPGAPTPASQSATSQVSPQMAQLGALLDLQNVEIDVTQAGESISGKPLPALANGMVAQIGLLQPGDKPAAPSASSVSFASSLATADNAPTQTVAAVTAPPAAQATADEPRAKTPANQDALVLNAPAPAGAAHASQTTATDQAAPAKFTLPTQPATDQVAVHIAKAAVEGSDKINIKLKPMTLGQIEVQLDVGSDGRVHAVIAADKPETLDLLQRDARGLERALNDAGLRTDSGSLSFNLRGQNQQFGQMPGNAGTPGGFGSPAGRAAPDMELLANASRIGAYLNSRAAAGGVDIQV